MNEPKHKHVFCFNEKDNGGESVSLTTTFFDNGEEPVEKAIFLNQEISLQSYCNSASINLCGAQITSEKLRELANQLDKAKFEACAKFKSLREIGKTLL